MYICQYFKINLIISCLFITGLRERHSVGGCCEPSSWSRLWNTLERTTSEGNSDDGRCSHGNTMPYSELHNFPVQVQSISCGNTHVACSHRYFHFNFQTWTHKYSVKVLREEIGIHKRG